MEYLFVYNKETYLYVVLFPSGITTFMVIEIFILYYTFE